MVLKRQAEARHRKWVKTDGDGRRKTEGDGEWRLEIGAARLPAGLGADRPPAHRNALWGEVARRGGSGADGGPPGGVRGGWGPPG